MNKVRLAFHAVGALRYIRLAAAAGAATGHKDPAVRALVLAAFINARAGGIVKADRDSKLSPEEHADLVLERLEKASGGDWTPWISISGLAALSFTRFFRWPLAVALGVATGAVPALLSRYLVDHREETREVIANFYVWRNEMMKAHLVGDELEKRVDE